MENEVTKIGILGCGPSDLLMLKRLIEKENSNIEISIFERKSILGVGMPYSEEGAKVKHVTNVSENEIPNIA